MKQFFLPSACALAALVSLTSCQKEDKSVLDLAKELTTELQTVTDYKSAQAAAPRVAAINKRYQDAGIRVFAMNETALLKSAENPEVYVEAVVALVKEIGRIRGSKPVVDYAGSVNADEVLMAIGQNRAAEPHTLADEQSKTDGTAYLQNTENKEHASTGNIEAYYGSNDLRDAIEYMGDATKIGLFYNDKEEPVAIPERASEEVVEGEDEAPADEEADAE